MHERFALPRLAFVRPYSACARSRCAGAAMLLGGAYDVCAAAAGFAGVTMLAIAELRTIEAFAACMSGLLCRGLLSCGPTVFVHDDNDAWVQRRRPVRCMLVHSCYWLRRYGGAGNCRITVSATRAIAARASFRSVPACFRATVRCACAIVMRGCSNAARWSV